MTASDSSSSGTNPERPSVDLVAASLLPPLPTAFLEGRELDLLRPLGWLSGAATDLPAGAEVDRSELAAGLASVNAGYGHPRAEELAAALAAPGTAVVVTGQQPGLFGGPLYTLSKAVAATLWAERLSRAGQPAVAVFWVATEDHDYREVARAAVLSPDGPIALDLGEDPSPLAPVGMRGLGPGLPPLLERFRDSNPGERWREWAARVGGWYRPDARFGEAFCRLFTHLLGERCPLLLDSMLPELKAAQRPWLERLVEQRQEVAAAFAARDREVAARGHELQVQPQPDASPLFVIHGGQRRRVEWRDGDRLRLRGGDEVDESVAWLLEIIADNPGAVSPGVLARAPLQDAVLGTSIQVLGPGEVSYAPQVAPLYELLGVGAPAVALRPQAMVLGSHQIDKLASLELGLAEFVAAELDLDRALAHGRDEDLLAPVRERIGLELAVLESSALEIDGNLEGPWRKTRAQVERALDAFGGKVAAALARQNELERRRALDLRHACRPLGGLQERVVCTANFPGKYGERLAAAYFEQLDLDPRRLQVIRP